MVRSHAVVAGIDLGPVTLPVADAAAETLVASAGAAGIDLGGLVVGTHRVVTPTGRSHLVVTVTGVGAAEWQMWIMARALTDTHPPLGVALGRQAVGEDEAIVAARAAVQERTSRIGGRCVHFPGVEEIVGTMTAGQIVAASAVDVVTEVGGGALAADAEVVTGGRVRPRWEFGALTLHVQHEGQGLYFPFESAPTLRVVRSP